MKIVLATGNQGKVKELKEILKDIDVEILSLKDFSQIGEIVEDGETFEENAIKKANAVCEAVQLVALADDSGLEVDYLNGAPGIYSARFAGEDKNDLDNNLKLLSLLDGVSEEKRTARFRCVIAVCVPGGETHTAEGTCEGTIGYDMRGANGFGYDSLFYLPEFDKTFAELDSGTKNKMSHRGLALANVKTVLMDIIEKRREKDESRGS